MMLEAYPKNLEDSESIKSRARRFYEFLISYATKNKICLCDSKLCIISHGTFLKFLTAAITNQVDEKDVMQNGEISTLKLNI